jgi:PAS domain-containing protein
MANANHLDRAEQVLRTSEGRLEASVELAGIGYYEVDFGESSSFADERFGDICGVPAGQQQGLQCVEFWIEHIHPDDRQHVLEERQKTHAGKTERYDVEYRYLHPSQGQKWIHQLGCVARRTAGLTSQGCSPWPAGVAPSPARQCSVDVTILAKYP